VRGSSLQVTRSRGSAFIGCAAAVLVVAIPATASAAEVCSPSPKVDSSFCVTYDVSATSTPPTHVAAAPFSTDLSLQNSSTNHSGDENRWLDHVTVELLSTGGSSPPVLTTSDKLPNHLLIAGGGSCTSPNFTDCGGGHGTLLVHVQNNAYIGNGFYGGTFGVAKIVNVNPPSAGDAVDWRISIKGCANVGFQFCSFPEQTFELEVPASGSGPVDPELSFPVRTRIAIGSGAGGGYADVSLDTGGVHFDSQSDQVDGGGTIAQPRTIATMPVRCGTASGTASFFDVAGASVLIPQSFTVTGCPTAAFSATPDGFAADFNGSASSTPIAGRTIAKWEWDFGDGTTKTTTGPTVSHTYSTGGDHTAKLTVVDSAGAISSQVSHVVPGTTTTLAAKTKQSKVKARGDVTPAHPGDKMDVTLLKRRHGSFHAVDEHHPTLTATSTYATAFHRVHGTTCEVAAVFPGDADHLASQASHTFGC
jgi:hypothetical protein